MTLKEPDMFYYCKEMHVSRVSMLYSKEMFFSNENRENEILLKDYSFASI